jgi:hypothetical protein
VIRPIKASYGINVIDYYSESLSSASSSDCTQVSTTNKKMGLAFGDYLVSGKIYSIVVNSGINSAGNVCSEILEA